MKRRVSDNLPSSIMSARGAHAEPYTAPTKRAPADDHKGAAMGPVRMSAADYAVVIQA